MKRLPVPVLILPVFGALLALGIATPASADTSDFHFTSFDGQYTLSRASDGTSQLTTKETLVAVFPDVDQNHGILRDLVSEYDGHPTDLKVVSVTDGDGTPISYDTDDEGDYEQLKIGDADRYVHGTQTYVITYRQHNVTKYFSDTDDDEFYWDTNGLDWDQSFDHVSATVTVDPSLAKSLSGRLAAYQGPAGSTEPATVAGSDNVVTASADGLQARENLTVVIGFAPRTFAERKAGFFDSPLPVLALIGLVLALIGLVLAIRLRATRLRNARGRGIIVPEYVAPKGVDLGISALVLGKTGKLTPASILDLAVKGNLRVLEDSSSRKSNYRLEYENATDADEYSTAFLHAIFGSTLTPGEDRALTSRDQSAAKAISALQTATKARARTEGYRAALPIRAMALAFLLVIVGVIVTWVFGAAAISADFGGGLPGAFIPIVVVVAIVAFVLLAKRPLTAKGVELRDYLTGLKVYIDLAEEDRLRYLQSPQGAEREPVKTEDRVAVVKLNEKLLPYAVLFGNEKKWATELGTYYQETGQAPSWYYGANGFNVGYFAASVGSITASAATTYSTSSASSGGSGGGGFSGGGGGGGGGGGW